MPGPILSNSQKGSKESVEAQKRFEAELLNDDQQKQLLQQQDYIKEQVIKHHGIYESQEIPSNLQTSAQKNSHRIESGLPTQLQQHQVKMPKSDSDGSQKANKGKKKIYLFDNKESHPVEEYKPDKEEEDSGTPFFVLEVTWPRVVLFYHPSSEHCVSFQQTYVSFARGVRHRSSRLPVEFHAVNCGIYREVCEEGFNIKRVPSLVAFKSGSIDHKCVTLPGFGDDGDGVKRSKEEISRDIDAKVEYIAKFLGFTLDPWSKNAHAAFPKAIGHKKSDYDGFNMYRDHNGVGNRKEKELRHSKRGYSSPSEQALQDAAASLFVTLSSSTYSQFPRGSVLPHDMSDALREFIDLIRWAYPPETKVHDMAEDLKMEFFSISTSEDAMLKVIGRHFSLQNSVAWSPRCNNEEDAEKDKGGYACGLWSLLHVLTIGVSERHHSVIGDVDRVTVPYAGKVIRAFIEKFFVGCDSCRKRWLEIYDDTCAKDNHGVEGYVTAEKLDESHWQKLSFCVWEIHNEINARRQNSSGGGYYHRLSRTASVSSIWPSQEECPKCWPNSLAVGGRGTVSMDSFNRDALYHYMKKIYWQGGVHNNRLIVLDRWTKAKRALSLKRLSNRLASRWYYSLAVNLVMLYSLYLLISWMFNTCSSGNQIDGARRKKTDQRRGRNLDEMLDQLDGVVERHSSYQQRLRHEKYNTGITRNSRFRSNRVHHVEEVGIDGRRYHSRSQNNYYHL